MLLRQKAEYILPTWQFENIEDHSYILFICADTPLQRSISVSRWCDIKDKSRSYSESIAENYQQLDYDYLGQLLVK